jgi:hypothetical protein
MKRTLYVLLLLFVLKTTLFAQDIDGQWKGYFKDISNSNNWEGSTSEYTLDITTHADSISGKSYTYFTAGGKKYYSICRIKGKYNKAKQSFVITEWGRIKTNIPDDVVNSYQTHTLKFTLKNGKTFLNGKWEPLVTDKQLKKSIGYGTTSLEKRQKSTLGLAYQQKNNHIKNPFNKSFIAKQVKIKEPTKVDLQLKKVPALIASNVKENINKKPIEEPKTRSETSFVKVEKPTINKVNITMPAATIDLDEDISVFEKRKTNVIQSLLIQNKKITVDIYDNGEIDGDSVTLFYNGKLLIAKKKLFIDPIRLELNVEEGSENELTMFAENLGTIPPNTALMIVMDGKKRFEVRVVSDLNKNGTIKFVREKINAN